MQFYWIITQIRKFRKGFLGCVLSLLDRDAVEGAFDGFTTRNRIYHTWALFQTFLSQVAMDGGCREAIEVGVNQGWLPVHTSPKTSAYCNARSRFPEAPLRGLAFSLGHSLEGAAGDEGLFCGRRVRVIDGTSVQLPDTASNQREYPQPNQQKPGCGFPVMYISVLMGLGSGAIIDAETIGGSGYERANFRTLWRSLEAGDIVLGDAGYGSYAEVAMLRERGVENRDSHLLYTAIICYHSLMPRIARIVIQGLPHHITQRGNNRQEVFLSPDDRKLYLTILGNQASRYGLKIAGYCLMPNHVHIIGIPSSEESLAKAVGRTHFHYAQHFNRLRQRNGHLWQNRFFSCALDEAHFVAAMAYIERNPVHAGLAGKPWDYGWSSAASHISGAPSVFLDTDMFSKAMNPDEWQSFLLREQPASTIQAIRSNTQTGRPIGDDKFLATLEKRLGLSLRPQPVGRPRVVKKGRRR